MNDNEKTNGYAKVWIARGRVIVSELHGYITDDISQDSIEQTKKLAAKLKESGKPILMLIDGSKVVSQTSGARTATKQLSTIGVKKVAVCGKGPVIHLVAQYIMRVSKVGSQARAFRNQERALDWLIKGDVVKPRHWVANNVVAVFLAVSSLFVTTQWLTVSSVLNDYNIQVFITNPVVALLFFITSIALLLMNYYYPKRPIYVSWFAGSIACLLFLFGFFVWLRTVFGIDLYVDKLIFKDKILPEVAAAPRTAMNMGLTAVMFLSILTGQAKKWQRYVFHIAALILFFNSLATIMWQAYGYSFNPVGYGAMSAMSAIGFLCVVFVLRGLTRPLAFSISVYDFIDRYKFAVLAFFVMLGLSGMIWQQAKKDLTNNIESKVSNEFEAQQNILTKRISTYGVLIYSFRSFFEASVDVEPDEYAVFFSSSAIKENYPGLNGLAYVKNVASSDVPKFEAEIRSKASVLNPQLSDFTVHPIVDQPTAMVITYIEPDKGTVKQALGYNLAASDERLRALEKARDEGVLVSTGTIDINSATIGESPTKPGFFIAAPIYSGEHITGEPQTVEDRRAMLTGYINASFVYEDVFNDLFADQKNNDIKFVISDASTNEIIYTNNPGLQNANSDPSYVSNIVVAGRTWHLEMFTNNNFGATPAERSLPSIVLSGSLALTALATLLIVLLMRRREQAVNLAEIMTEDLNFERDKAVAAKVKNDTILASIGDAVFAIDTTGRITLFNYATEVISGYKAEEAIGKPYKQFLHFVYEEGSKTEATFIQHALKGHIAHMRNHTYLIRKDGMRVAVSDSAAPIHDEKGKIAGAIIVFRDVTREAELSRAKDEFVSLASHQLRTPLSAINWYVEMLLAGDAGKLGKEQTKYLQEVFDGNQRMIKLVNSLLDVSRIDLGKFINEPVPASIKSVISSLKSELAMDIAEKHINFVTKISKNVSNINIDPRLLRIVLQNVLSNAVKYSNDKGEVIVVVRPAEPSDGPMHTCPMHKTCTLISVTDKGIGIPKDQQSHIFEKLFRADNARTREVEGNGLGLYLVREIIKRLGGVMWFISKENEGTTFYVVLPTNTKPTGSKK